MGTVSSPSAPTTLDSRVERLYRLGGVQGLRERNKKRKTETWRKRQQGAHSPWPLMTPKNNTNTVNCAYLAPTYCTLTRAPSQTSQLKSAQGAGEILLWPGMTWNSMLKYVHRSKYSPSVSRLQLFLLSALLCLVVSFGICSRFQSTKKKKRKKERKKKKTEMETEQDDGREVGGWSVCLASHKHYSGSFSCNPRSRAALSMFNRNAGQKTSSKKSLGHAPS